MASPHGETGVALERLYAKKAMSYIAIVASKSDALAAENGK